MKHLVKLGRDGVEVPSFVNHCLSLKGAQDWVLHSGFKDRTVRRLKASLHEEGRGGPSAAGRGTSRGQLLKMWIF